MILMLLKYQEYQEKLNFKFEIEKLKSELEHYKSLESTFNRALLVAEDAGQQIRNSARNESITIIEDAKRNADRIINNALIKASLKSIDDLI